MMKKIGSVVVFLFVLFCLTINLSFAQPALTPTATVVKTADVNKDGTPDITYYGEGKYVTRADADTNYDGKPDIVVHAKDGKFESAEVDTNYDGTPDKKFTDVSEFNKWLNENNPDFDKYLNQPDWEVALFNF